MKYHYDANRQDSKLYQKWNATTAICFYYKMCCNKCPNQEACKLSENSNKYNIKQVKFATLMTYANLGLHGLKRYLLEEREDANDE